MLTVISAPAPRSPFGISKFRATPLVVVDVVTFADSSAATVLTEPMEIVGVLPSAPFAPVAPVAPVAPHGIVKFSTASISVPLLVTKTLLPALPVVTIPTLTVAALPSLPFSPFCPSSPLSPFGMIKFRIASVAVPDIITLASVPAAPVLTSPMLIVAGVFRSLVLSSSVRW